MSTVVPNDTAPVTSRLTRADFPVPGWPRTNTPGLVTRPARSQASGSRQTTSPHSWCRPTGVPAVGVPLPATNGNNPHNWVVVAWYSRPGETCTARPASGIFQPQAGASGSCVTCVGGSTARRPGARLAGRSLAGRNLLGRGGTAPNSAGGGPAGWGLVLGSAVVDVVGMTVPRSVA